MVDSRREPDENPYFYEILIGDVFIEKDDPDKALEHYLKALEREVEKPLVSDRIRRVAKYLAANKKCREALSILHKYRDLDDLIFDGDIEEISKLMVKWEDER